MAAESGTCALPSRLKLSILRLVQLLKKHFLVFCFVIAVLVALTLPALGKTVVSVEVGPFRVFQILPIIIVFLISGMSLNTAEMKRARQHWKGLLWGILVILAITPCAGFALRKLPLKVPEFSLGFTTFSTAPTTLGVGAALVRSCLGNDFLATVLMTTTSFLCVLTMPVWLSLLLDEGLEIDGGLVDLALLWKMALTVLAPAILGKVLRECSPKARCFVTKHKEFLSMVSVVCLAFMVWQTLSGAQQTLAHQNIEDVVYIIIIASCQHLGFLIFNSFALRVLFPKMPVEEAIAICIMGSQKSSPVAVSAITFITKDVRTQGLLSLPCIVGQLVQVFMAAFIAPLVARRVRQIQSARTQQENAGEKEATSQDAKDVEVKKVQPDEAQDERVQKFSTTEDDVREVSDVKL